MTTDTATATSRAPRRASGQPGAAGALDLALAPISADLSAVTQRIESQLTDPIARTVLYLINAGGKRLRPALVLLAGACGPRPNRTALIDAATAVELIHTATLIHDDIIDQSPVRRSQPTFHQRWGTERAVLMGDYLYATAFKLLTRLESPFVMRTMADVCQELCRGELSEVEARFRLDLSEGEYFAIIKDKTASLIGGSCASGAFLAGCGPAVIDGLAAFGVNFGLAFQIMDDCLDLTGTQRELGKSVLADLDKGALSLPIIYLTQALGATERRTLFAPLKTHATDAAFLARVAKAAERAGAIAKAQAKAQSLIQDAWQTLAELPLNGMQGTYQTLAAYAVARRS